MAVTIDYLTQEILVPKADTIFFEFDALTGREKRRLDLTDFGKALADIQDDEADVWASTAFSYTASINVGGIDLAPVLSILSPYKATFEAGDWAVFLINGNTNIQDVSTVNGVSVFPSNSGGLVGANEISNQSYIDGKVFINTEGIGSATGKGTPTDQVDTYARGKSIADIIKLKGFYLTGNITLGAGEVVTNTNWVGSSPANAVIVAQGNDIDKTTFTRVALVGAVSGGRASFVDCSLGKTIGLTGLQGIMVDCALSGNITLDSAATEPIVFKDCISAMAGANKPEVNCNNVTAPINFRRQTGGLKITNFNGGGDMSIDAGGVLRLEIAPSCTSGTIVVGGVVQIIDNSGPGCTVINASAVENLVWNKVTP